MVAQRREFERTTALLQTEVKLRAHAQNELGNAYEAALEGTRIKTAFLANISHELRTPMNAVLGLTDLILKDELTASHRENLETVRDSSHGLLRLLDDLLDLSKIEAGAMRLDRIDFSVRDVLSQIERLLGPRAQAQGIEFRVVCLERVPPMLLGDPHRLTQVLTNLVGNSIKFTSKGQVTTRVDWDAEVLTVEVSDTGVGMSPEQMAQLFQPFRQGDASTTRRFGGTGLGLAIVKRLCHLHQGDVKVSSQLHSGSVFTATLRFARGAERPEAQAAVVQPINAVVRLDGLRVLVAEDNAINQRVIQRLLERLGVVCQVVSNGAEALERLRQSHWPVVLMDIQMPVMDGLEATRHIRKLAIPQPFIIALSANAMDEDKKSAKEAGLNAYLSKPVTLDGLATALQRATVATPHGEPA